MTKEQPDETEVQNWVKQAQEGRLSWTELGERILRLQYQTDAPDRPDFDRGRRCGFGEVIFGSGKSPETCIAIAQDLLKGSDSDEVLITRLESGAAQTIAREFAQHRHSPTGRTLRLSENPISEVRKVPCPAPERLTPTFVLTAGSTDAPVAEEALETLRWMGVDAEWIADVGVAGPYRLLAHLERLRKANCVVVAAGMEGALASVVGGLVPCPVIAVPTSVGYGANFEGITTLLSMMSSCAAGVTAVNIDAGFKGGYVAGLIAHQVAS